jgi:putative membrane protein
MDISDDLVGTVIGHGALSKLSRRFGEGAVNGALTARIGLRAQAICRPLEFDAEEQPSMQRILGAALAGLFGQTRK